MTQQLPTTSDRIVESNKFFPSFPQYAAQVDLSSTVQSFLECRWQNAHKLSAFLGRNRKTSLPRRRKSGLTENRLATEDFAEARQAGGNSVTIDDVQLNPTFPFANQGAEIMGEIGYLESCTWCFIELSLTVSPWRIYEYRCDCKQTLCISKNKRVVRPGIAKSLGICSWGATSL